MRADTRKKLLILDDKTIFCLTVICLSFPKFHFCHANTKWKLFSKKNRKSPDRNVKWRWEEDEMEKKTETS